MIVELLEKVARREDLSRAELARAVDLLIAGECSDVQFAGLLIGLRVKGEAAEEIIGAAAALRARALKPPMASVPMVDTAGTGGDGSGSLNLSTLGALVAAGAGATVAKHGNRALSSKCGSADMLEALGVPVDLGPEDAGRCFDQTGFCFLFAPTYHPATKAVAAVRRALAVRTLFNLLGPLTNPSGVRSQVVGVYHPSRTRMMAEALGALGCQRALVVSGAGGMDEIAPNGATHVAELKNGAIAERIITPADFGLPDSAPDSVKGGDPAYNAAVALDILRGNDHPARPSVLMSAGAALFVADLAESLRDGAALAARAIDSGATMGVVEKLRSFRKMAA